MLQKIWLASGCHNIESDPLRRSQLERHQQQQQQHAVALDDDDVLSRSRNSSFQPVDITNSEDEETLQAAIPTSWKTNNNVALDSTQQQSTAFAALQQQQPPQQQQSQLATNYTTATHTTPSKLNTGIVFFRLFLISSHFSLPFVSLCFFVFSFFLYSWNFVYSSKCRIWCTTSSDCNRIQYQ
jgi:hypothetical protein